MAKSAALRKQEQRERDRLADEERLGIEEPQDLISRLIHGADRLDDETLREITDV